MFNVMMIKKIYQNSKQCNGGVFKLICSFP